MYLLKRRNIPKLAFDWIWKESNYKGMISVYCIKVKRNNRVTPIAVQKEESNVEILLHHI